MGFSLQLCLPSNSLVISSRNLFGSTCISGEEPCHVLVGVCTVSLNLSMYLRHSFHASFVSAKVFEAFGGAFLSVMRNILLACGGSLAFKTVNQLTS